jgi:hypothetical protein
VNDYLLDRSCAEAEYILLLQVQGRVPSPADFRAGELKQPTIVWRGQTTRCAAGSLLRQGKNVLS